MSPQIELKTVVVFPVGINDRDAVVDSEVAGQH